MASFGHRKNYRKAVNVLIHSNSKDGTQFKKLEKLIKIYESKKNKSLYLGNLGKIQRKPIRKNSLSSIYNSQTYDIIEEDED